MNYRTQQDLLNFVKDIADGNLKAGLLSERIGIVAQASALVKQAERGGTIRDAIEDTKARFGHYANGIYILEQALIDSTVGKGGSCYVRPANSLADPICITQSEGFQKAREADDLALVSFVQHPSNSKPQFRIR